VPVLADDDVVVQREPRGFAALAICRVISTSTAEGVGSPEE